MKICVALDFTRLFAALTLKEMLGPKGDLPGWQCGAGWPELPRENVDVHLSPRQNSLRILQVHECTTVDQGVFCISERPYNS